MRMTTAASTSALLPARCPCASLTPLNPSRSMNSSDRAGRFWMRASSAPPQHLRQVARVVELGEVVGDRQRLDPLYS